MNPEQPTHLILRFRDLVTEPGGTLRKHKAILEAKTDHVWWGWWSKGGESVPLECFAALQTKLQKAPHEFVLFDSGRGGLHLVRCAGIAWDPTGQPIDSPDKNRTPEYYRDQKYRAWFKLTAIDEQPSDEKVVLQGLAYVRVDGFFDSGESKYGRFYGKQVFSSAELKQQDRSIWFVRQLREEDPRHEVLLQDPQSLAPEHFARSFFPTSYRSLLWLSDLHFSKDATHHRFQPTVASSKLEVAVEGALRNKGVSIGGLLVSGDLTWRADKAEFDLARESLGALFSMLRLQAYHSAVCPGNHDLAFSADPAAKESPVEKVSAESRAGFESFYEALYYLKPNAHIASGRRFLLGSAVPVEVVALNSSALQQSQNMFQGHGFVGQPQLDEVAKGMGWGEGESVRPFRILMLHHHLVPVTYREEPVAGWSYSVVLDAVAILRWAVKHGIRLVLHGHMHQPSIKRIRLPKDEADPDSNWHEIYVAGMGSTGVQVSHLGANGQNTFGVLTFEGVAVSIDVYSVHPTAESMPVWSVKVPYAQPESA